MTAPVPADDRSTVSPGVFTQTTVQLAPYRIQWLARLMYGNIFEFFVIGVIIVNAAALAVLTYADVDPSIVAIALFIDSAALVFYTVEVALRLISYGAKPWMFFRNPWNVFDFLIVVLIPFLGNGSVVFRLVRLLRILRIFRFLPEARILMLSMIKSVAPLANLAVLILFLMFIYAMAGVYLFGEADPDSWGNVGAAMVSLTILLTLENFPDSFTGGLAITPWALLYFLSYMFFIVFTVLNILIGIVLTAMDQAREEVTAERTAEGQPTVTGTVRVPSAAAVAADADARASRAELDALAAELDGVADAGTASPDHIRRIRDEIDRLRAGTPLMRGRAVAAGVLATLGLLLLPAAIMANWATTQLVQTERFVAALAPLADDPVVQDRIIAEVTALVDEQVDIDTVTAELLAGLGEALDLGPRAQAALDLVSAPVAAGVRSLVADVVTEVVRSDAFSAAWERSVEVLHSQTIRLLAGSPDSLLALDRDGTLSLPLGPIVADVRTALVEQGVPFAAAIPDVDRSIVLAEVPNLALARVVYQVGVSVGLWLPWITAALLVGAVLLAPRRSPTLRTLGLVVLGVTAALAVGFSLARTAIVAYVGPDSAAVAGLAFDAVAGSAIAAVLGVLALSTLVIAVGWYTGSSPSAARAQGAVDSAVTTMRSRVARPAPPPGG